MNMAADQNIIAEFGRHGSNYCAADVEEPFDKYKFLRNINKLEKCKLRL